MGTFFEFASNITTMLYLVFLLLKDDWFENLSTIHLPSEKIQMAKATSKGVLDSNYFNNHLWNHLSVSLQMKSNFFREQYPLYHCVKFRNFNNFLVRKFCGKAQFPHSFGNCAFQQNFQTRKLCEITAFYVVYSF